MRERARFGRVFRSVFSYGSPTTPIECGMKDALFFLPSCRIKSKRQNGMLFNSLIFAMFLPAVFAGYWLMQKNFKAQNLWLLVASYVFYGWWDWRYLFLIAACSTVNFWAGRLIYDSNSKMLRRGLLSLCCLVCLGALGIFKYFH